MSILTRTRAHLPGRSLAAQLSALRANISRRSFANTAGVDSKIIAGLETGRGTLASLRRVADALGHYVSPYPSALANKRLHLGIGIRGCGVSHPALLSLEQTGDGLVATYETVCKALGERPRLLTIVPTWYTQEPLLRAILDGLGLDRFDLDPASPCPPTAPTRTYFTERDGGLWLPWTARTVWCNPPYDQVPAWTDKARAEITAGRAQRLLLLIPYRPETKCHQSLVADPTARILIFDRRITFGGRRNHLDSASALVCWGLSDVEFVRLAGHLPASHELRMSPVGNRPHLPAI